MNYEVFLKAVLAAIFFAVLTSLSEGVLMSIFGIMVLIYLHEIGHWVVARSFGFSVPTFSVGMGSYPRLLLGRFWGTEFQLTPWLVGGYVAIDPSSREFCSAPAWKRALVLAAGPLMNFLVAFLIFVLLVSTAGIRVQRLEALEITALSASNSIAREAGIKVGDRVIALDDHRLQSPGDFLVQMSGHQSSAAKLTVERGGDKMDFSVTPDRFGHIGVDIKPDLVTRFRKVDAFEALSYSLSETRDLSVMVLQGLGMIFGVLPVPQGLPEGADDVHGLVGVVQWGAAMASEGFYSFLKVMALISINLAVLNLLPLPVLDGGHLLFVLIEKLRGVPVSRETQRLAMNVFIWFLVGIFLLGLANDILHPLTLG